MAGLTTLDPLPSALPDDPRLDLELALQRERDARDYAEAIVATVREPLLVLDGELRVLSVNRAFQRKFGTLGGDALGKHLYELGQGQWNLPILRELLTEIIPAQTEIHDFEVIADFPILGRRTLYLNARRMTRSRSDVPTILLAIEDVTERRAIEQQRDEAFGVLSQRTRELERTNRELDGFTYSVSHDLRAPLRAINGFCKILAEDYAHDLDAEGQRVIGVIRRNATRMGELIDDLLLFSRLGRQPLVKGRSDMRALARAAADDALATEPDRSIEVSIGELPFAECDATLLKQVFFNLIGNSVKYSRSVENACIEVRGEQDGSELRYEVSDNGVGFDMQYAHKLFGVFQRLHAVSEFEGTGVGLALVQRVVERHGGRVWARSEPNRGATFGFALPVTDGR